MLAMHFFLDWFYSYTKNFITGSPEDKATIELKIQHSKRVLNEAKILTHSIRITQDFAYLIHLAALFHDLGRFLQYSKFKTFDDSKSVNHALLSVEVLRKRAILSELCPENQQLILRAVSLHNRRSLPRMISPKLSLATKILRDADKLDIIPLCLGHLYSSGPENSIAGVNLKPDPHKYSESILKQVLSKKVPQFDRVVWLNDYKLMLCSWLYDLNFGISCGEIISRGYLDRLLQLLPKSREFHLLGEQLKEDLFKRVKESNGHKR